MTDMGQPLGRMAGHSNEVAEAIDILKGKGPKDLRELSVELSAWMFYLGERTPTVERRAAAGGGDDRDAGKHWKNSGSASGCKEAMNG